ncbi:hypothetical protein [Arthrobacter sp. H20]|uniref:hypothetical protein n=1 Tax=Arthrobacter sp. H20 TaxID=1267981 RepID=UPI00047EE437|nr:hypothetical protein [Arthrobacter sp. H20]
MSAVLAVSGQHHNNEWGLNVSENYPGNQPNQPGGNQSDDPKKYPAGQQWQQPAPDSQPTPYGQQSSPSTQQAPYGQPGGYGQGPYGAGPGYGQPTENPGKTLGIVGMICSIIWPISVVGLIISIVAMVKSRKARMGNGFALAGIIIGAIGVITGVIAVVAIIAGVSFFAEVCADLGTGVHQYEGTEITCP